MKRLNEIANMVEEGMIVADIGTDHAFLPLLLAESGKSSKIYACDVAEGPLESARKNISDANMQNVIEVIASDGFANVPSDAQCAVIAGMGCRTAVGILERAGSRIQDFHQIIVAVHNDVDVMREWISDHAYTIQNESVVSERNHMYVIISFNSEPHVPYSREEILVGPILAQKNTEVFRQYCREICDKAEYILSLRKKEDPEIPLIEERLRVFRKYR